MKTYWGSVGIAPRIFNIGPRWRWVVSFTPWPLYPRRKSPQYPVDRRLGGPQSRSWRGGEEKKIPSLLLPGNDPVRPGCSLVSILTELPWLLAKSSTFYIFIKNWWDSRLHK
jgi:hypothetical protein